HDDYTIYNYLPGYEDVAINHSEGEYVKGEAHTNTIEGIFSLLNPNSAVYPIGSAWGKRAMISRVFLGIWEYTSFFSRR
ncbi:hypothetical protein AKJ62_03565, partial [candidate division MSBL1 archaeon SCGC-AAA259D14]